MSRISKRATASEMLEILKKPWLCTKDIKILGSVGSDKARKIKNKITYDLQEQNYFLPSGLVPSEKVIEYLHLNIKYLKKIANE